MGTFARSKVALVAVALSIVGSFAGCTPADGDPGEGQTTTTTTTTTDPGWQESACKVDLRTLKTAVEADRAFHGSYPPDQATVVADGFLAQPSEYWDFATIGTAVVYALRPSVAGGANPCVPFF